jgi:ABC-2 type transport system permease protein
MKWNVLKAIFKRDFVSYFSSPTGYVFICVFVMLSALATFWPPEFFANNLANLDQLSLYLPFIMLVFIPAITMSIWAEERRQGTDELLLTIPASDFDVVLGKYLAGVAIFTVSLLFSAISIFIVFKYGLGDPDPGLFISTYLGYWFIGVAMIAIGMVASFLTANLTVGFILGALFNLPLAAFGVADWLVKNPTWAERIRRWGALEQFADFQRGVISLGGIAYFVLIAVVMIYLSMVLIGRRHWQSREDGAVLGLHYFLRALALLAIAVGVTMAVQSRNWLRADVSFAQLSSLSPDTKKLLAELVANKDVKSVKIDAYISPHVPTEFSPAKMALVSTLEELRALGGGKIVVDRHEIPTYGPEADLAEKNFGITPREQSVIEHGEQVSDEFFLGFAVTSGLDKVVTPFLNKGIPVEYELIRSIMTVAGAKRLRIGVVDTGLPILGSGEAGRDGEWPLAAELRKQFDVESVNPAQAIKGKYDALLAIQPSMLEPAALDNLVDAIRGGTPTVVLEDPFPFLYGEWVAGTGEEKQSQMAMFGMSQPEPKGDIEQLWRLLGVRVDPMRVVFQDYSPPQSIKQYEDPQWLFIDKGNQAPMPFSQKSPITSKLNQVLLLYAGAIQRVDDAKLNFEQLLQTGVGNSGTVPTVQSSIMGRRPVLQRLSDRVPGSPNKRGLPWDRTPREGYVVAAHISGAPPEEDAALDPAAGLEGDVDPAELAKEKGADQAKPPEINVVLVTDIDWIVPYFFDIREAGNKNFLPVTQNVPFILNIVDYLAGEHRFLEIRKRAPSYRTLTKIDEATRAARDKATEENEAIEKEFREKVEAAQAAMDKKVDQIESRTDLKDLEREVLLRQTQMDEQKKLAAEAESLEAQQKRRQKEIAFERDTNVRAVQNLYKMLGLLIPPVLPMLLAVFVFFRRREIERQGVARERLR